MRFFSVKKMSEVTGLTEEKIRKLIRSQKIKADVDINGCYSIPEFEVKRCLEEKKKIDSGDYFNADYLDAIKVKRTILYDGSIEVEILLGQHYVKWDNLKKWMLSQNQDNFSCAENKMAIANIEILNKRGIHFRPSALACKTCQRYLCAGTFCGIIHGNDVWVYPINGSNDLLKMEIEFHEMITIFCIGVLCENLLSAVEKDINTEFNLSK